MSCCYKLGRGHRERVAVEVDHLAPSGIELGVDQLPPPVGGVPVLGHPVILEPPRAEVGTEPAAGAGGHACSPKERDREPAEGMAACSDTAGWGPRLRERTGVHGPRDGEEAGRVAFVDRFGLFRRELDAVERLGDDVVHQQPLHDLHDRADVTRREVAVVEAGEAARFGVEVERLAIHTPILPSQPGGRRDDTRLRTECLRGAVTVPSSWREQGVRLGLFRDAPAAAANSAAQRQFCWRRKVTWRDHG